MDEPSPTPDPEAWLLVSQAPGIGSRYFQRLLARFGSPEAVLRAPHGALTELGIPATAVDGLKRRTSSDIEPTLAWLRQPGHRLLTLDDDNYPHLLKAIDDPPPLLYLIGNPALLNQPGGRSSG